MDAGYTGFIHAIMITGSSWNLAFFMTPDCLVPIVNAIGEGSLFLALSFVKTKIT